MEREILLNKTAVRIKEDLNAESSSKAIQNTNISPSKNNYEKELKDLHEALLFIDEKQFDLMRELEIFRWEFRCNSGSFMTLVPGRFVNLLSTLLRCSSLFNVWRLPYLCYKYNPAVFLITFIIMLFCVASPMFLLEYSLGQFTSFSYANCWGFCPGMNGIGLAMLLLSFLLVYYYSGIVAYTIFMFFNSFNDPLSWLVCDVTDGNITMICDNVLQNFYMRCLPTANYSRTASGYCVNEQDEIIGVYDKGRPMLHNIFLQTSTAQFIEHRLLNWGEFGCGFTPNANLVLTSYLIWLIVGFLTFLLARRIFPSSFQILLTIICIYFGFAILFYYSLELGFHYGWEYMTTPDWRYIYYGSMWRDAASQALIMMSVGIGKSIYLGSHNRFKNDVVFDTILRAILTGIMSIFVIFLSYNYLGMIADKTGTPIEYIIRQPLVLFLLIYGQAATYFTFPPFSAFVIFLFLSIIGIFEIVIMVDYCLNGLVDRFPSLHKRKYLIIISLTLFMIVTQLPLSMPIGYHIIETMDSIILGNSYLCIVIIECSVVAYVYSIRNFCQDIEAMVKGTSFLLTPWFIIKWIWQIFWLIITPTFLLFAIIYSLATFNTINSDTGVWFLILDLLVCSIFMSICFLPGLILIKYREGNIIQKFMKIYRPSITWGPNLPCFRALCTNKALIIDPWTYKPLELDDLKKFYHAAEIPKTTNTNSETTPNDAIKKKIV